jgi:hypothetical protein
LASIVLNICQYAYRNKNIEGTNPPANLIFPDLPNPYE